jgi:hypothetical protein
MHMPVELNQPSCAPTRRARFCGCIQRHQGWDHPIFCLARGNKETWTISHKHDKHAAILPRSRPLLQGKAYVMLVWIYRCSDDYNEELALSGESACSRASGELRWQHSLLGPQLLHDATPFPTSCASFYKGRLVWWNNFDSRMCVHPHVARCSWCGGGFNGWRGVMLVSYGT